MYIEMNQRRGNIYIGTSGWHYSHWKGPFYPKDMPEKQFFSYYVQKFSTVEINRTFYSLPKKTVFQGYAQSVSKEFIFAVKGSRFITHVKRLKDPKQSLRRLFTRIEGLKSHLGPILFQLPPKWKVNPERLKSFLKALPKRHRFAFEFRDPSWITDEIFAALRKYHAAFCIYEFDYFTTPKIITSDFVYIRLHGSKDAYAGNYSKAELKKWASFIKQTAKKGLDVYCYFDNDQAGYAARNAAELILLLKKS